jgi:voltage-gated potassium channel
MDASHLESLSLFSTLSKRERDVVARCADEIDLPAGKELVHEGDFAYEFFVIEDGTAEVRCDDAHVADLGPGDFFGEMAALAKGRRNASVVTTSPTTAIVMTARDLRAISQQLPEVGERLRAAAEERARAVLQ